MNPTACGASGSLRPPWPWLSNAGVWSRTANRYPNKARSGADVSFKNLSAARIIEDYGPFRERNALIKVAVDVSRR